MIAILEQLRDNEDDTQQEKEMRVLLETVLENFQLEGELKDFYVTKGHQSDSVN